MTPLAAEILADLPREFPCGATVRDLCLWLGEDAVSIRGALTELHSTRKAHQLEGRWSEGWRHAGRDACPTRKHRETIIRMLGAGIRQCDIVAELGVTESVVHTVTREWRADAAKRSVDLA